MCGFLPSVVALRCKFGVVMRFVSKSVMTGFVNALAILIFLAQLPELNLALGGVSWITYAMVAAGLGSTTTTLIRTCLVPILLFR